MSAVTSVQQVTWVHDCHMQKIPASPEEEVTTKTSCKMCRTLDFHSIVLTLVLGIW